MKWEKMKRFFWPLFFAAACSTELLILADMVVLFWRKDVSLLELAIAWIAIMLAVGFLLRWRVKRILAVMITVPAVCALVLGISVACWKSFGSNADYEFQDEGKEQLFGNRKVMLIVPHQDDDINVLGGAMEEYVRYGSTLYPVFVTNGDYLGMTETRYQEALSVFEQIGVPAEQVIFLGYGDDWKEDGPHLYNTAPGITVESHIGKTETYGTEFHSAYREGRAYTIDHLMEDLSSVILEYRPDVIFCSDYDYHIDHRAVTLVFDKVMGQMLKANPDYHPVVYKAYAYSTAWYATKDYYQDNMLSTRNPFEEGRGQEAPVYRWEDRIRIPVDGAIMSRSLITSGGYELMKLYESQGAHEMAIRVINGDKVAWRRRTDSLCLRAELTVSSGNGNLLNDFMLIENHDLRDEERKPHDGVWTPNQKDKERTVTVTLEVPSDIASVVLYDHPDPETNVLNAKVIFDDGTEVETGPLSSSGAATAVAVEKRGVSMFQVVLTETEGDKAGLSEVEAFAQPCEADGRFIKLMDQDENFLYDYITAPDGKSELTLYIHGNLPKVSGEHYIIHTEGRTGTAVLKDGVIQVHCPVGEEMVLHVVCREADVSDSIVIRNPGFLERGRMKFGRAVEKAYLPYNPYPTEDLLITAVFRKVFSLIQRLS